MFTDTILPPREGFESIHHFKDETVGLEGLLAFTGNRPSIGGIRYLPGTSFEEALKIVCGLASAMADKAAAAGLQSDGAKMFIFKGEKTSALLHTVGDFVESLGGRYIASIDIGTNPDDIAIVGDRTRYASHGDPSLSTAEGVVSAICAFARMTDIDLSSLRVFISGVCGEVGSRVAMLLRRLGVSLSGKDITVDPARIGRAKAFGVDLVSTDEFPSVDIFVPCARGGILNEQSITSLSQAGIRAVIGSANCQLEDGEADALRLHRAGILYAPDYVVNRGGLLFVGDQFGLVENFKDKVWRTGDVIVELFTQSLSLGVPVTVVAKKYFEGQQTAA